MYTTRILNIYYMAGRPCNSLQIVDALFQPHEIIALVPDLITLGGELNNKLSILQWLAERRLLTNSFYCPHCSQLCTLCQCFAEDGCRWRCHMHNYTQSVRQNSFFEGSKVPLDTAIVLLYCWLVDFL